MANSKLYSATIELSPNPGPLSPNNFTSQCMVGGTAVDLYTCIPNSIHLLSTELSGGPVEFLPPSNQLSPSVIQVSQKPSAFVFQSWLKTAKQADQVLIAAYGSISTREDEVFSIRIHQNQSLSLTLKVSDGVYDSYTVTLNTTVADGDWHYVLVSALPSEAAVLVDGRVVGRLILNRAMLIANQIHLYVGQTKTSDETNFSGHLWGTLISFDYAEDQIFSYVSCSLSCGESLSTTVNVSSSVYEVFISPYKLFFLSSDLGGFVFMLRHLQYSSYASEPSTQLRTVDIQISNQRSEVNQNLSVSVKLRNDHTAILESNVGRKNLYYVTPEAEPHLHIVNDKLLFSDGDTTQQDYEIRVDLVPPLQRACDRLDYTLKIKLEQCGYIGNQNIFNLLPLFRWGLAAVQNLQLHYGSLLGYYFVRSGSVLIPERALYNDLTLNPTHFTLALWAQYRGPGTIVHIRNQTRNFLLQLRVDVMSFRTTYSVADITATHTWAWEGRKGWVHIALSVEGNLIRLCLDGFMCSSQDLGFNVRDSRRISGLEIHVGAAPTGTGSHYSDHFHGSLNSMGLVSDYTIPLEILSCIVLCSERLIIKGLVTDDTLKFSSTTFAVNGSLQVSGNLQQNQVQEVLRRVSYVNSYPYPVPGTRAIKYAVRDGNITLQASSSVVVLFHSYRNLRLLGIGRAITSTNLQNGIKVFGGARISSDTKSTSLDSLLVEIYGSLAEASSCYRRGASNHDHCPHLFHLSKELIRNTSLQLLSRPNKLLVMGLSDVSQYQLLLREISIQATNVEAVLSRSSDIRIRVYISDQNGLSSSSRIAAFSVTGSSGRKKREIGEEGVSSDATNSDNKIMGRPREEVSDQRELLSSSSRNITSSTFILVMLLFIAYYHLDQV
jgi:hypothetical protein